MGKIQVLDEHIANQIAAGEVVERPASVIKELVENAVDAGATKIDISAEEGGLESIRITDNGSGIEPEDTETAFYRHATSKLSSSRDLFQIRTLGFRGEALPSIAAVAKVQLLSASSESGLGRKVVIEGGALKETEDAPSPRGTDITVRELFFNTPARLKYMKTIQTELGHISDVVYRQALAHPEIAITLKHNGNTLLQTAGSGDLLQVIAAIYGTNAAKGMLKLEAEDPDYKLTGFSGRPELTRSNRAGISTIVNGRYIRSQVLQQAILRAYHTLLPIGRYPLAVLELSMHPSLVDVNVHPAKLEVRFSKEAELSLFVENAVKQALSREVLIPHAVQQKITRGGSTSVIQEQFNFKSGFQETASTVEPGQPAMETSNGLVNLDKPSIENSEASLKDESRPRSDVRNEVRGSSETGHQLYASSIREPDGSTGVREKSSSTGNAASFAEGYGSYSASSWQGQKSGAGRDSGNGSRGGSAEPRFSEAWRLRPQVPEEANRLYEQTQEKPSLPAFPELHLIGQHHGTYLIANNETGLYLIDQHAAHERVNYEYYYEKFGAPAAASQGLLIPVTIEFTPSEAEKLKGRLQWFEAVGVILEHFGGQTFRVTAYPHWFPQGEEQALIEEMAEWVLNEKTIDLSKMREASSVMCSCRASIKANQKLTEMEAETLLKRLAACRQPYTCPHGRPIVVSFSTYDLEKLFKRVM